MSERGKPDGTARNPAAAPQPSPPPAIADPVAAAEEHLANLDMKAQREALRKLSRSL